MLLKYELKHNYTCPQLKREINPVPVKCWPSPAPTKHRELSSCRLGITIWKSLINLSYNKIIILDGLVAPRLPTHEYGQMRKTSVILRKHSEKLTPINIGCGSMDDMPCIFNYCVTGIVGPLGTVSRPKWIGSTRSVCALGTVSRPKENRQHSECVCI